jgi:S1-C subfamily serine protease
MFAKRQMKVLSVLAAVLLLSFTAWSIVAAQENSDMTPESLPMERPSLGVRLENADNTVIVREVFQDTAAAEAGLQEGDVITAVNGTAVSSAREVADLVAALNPGDTVTLDYTRDGESDSVDVVLGSARFGFPGRGRLGAIIVYNADDQTWQIENLSEDSPLYEAGLRSGDTITALNCEQVDPMTVRDYLADQEDTVTVTVERDGESLEIEVPTAALNVPGFGGLHPLGGMHGFDHGGRLGQPFDRDNPPSQGNRPDLGNPPGQNNPSGGGTPFVTQQDDSGTATL